jgi:hypothetical protein
MLRTVSVSCLACLLASPAFAGGKDDKPMQFEVGFNTRHFSAASAESGAAFRSSTGEGQTEPGLEAGTALTTSLRFTGRAWSSSFLGVEAEFGEMLGITGSNVAGAYGVAGTRAELGSLRIAAELVAGRRWVRYELMEKSDPSAMIAEPRVRADLWVAPKLTLGAAAGATLGDRSVWMAGIYLGIHSFQYDRTP